MRHWRSIWGRRWSWWRLCWPGRRPLYACSIGQFNRICIHLYIHNVSTDCSGNYIHGSQLKGTNSNSYPVNTILYKVAGIKVSLCSEFRAFNFHETVFINFIAACWPCAHKKFTLMSGWPLIALVLRSYIGIFYPDHFIFYIFYVPKGCSELLLGIIPRTLVRNTY